MLYTLGMFVRIPVAVVFIVAGASKWWTGDDLVRVLLTSGFPPLLANSLTWVLRPLEAAIGVSLLMERRAKAAAHTLAIVTLVAFTAFPLAIHLSGKNSGCGCFGRLGLDSASAAWSIGRNLALMALTLASWFLVRHRSGRHAEAVGEMR